MNKGIMTKKIEDIEEYVPNMEHFRIHLDANESPYLPSDEILEEFSEIVKKVNYNRYPDPTAKELLTDYAAIYGIDPANLVAGDGSDELLSLICGAFTDPGDAITVLVPDFSMYELYGKYAAAQVIRYQKDENYDFDLAELAKFVNENRSKILIFSNPCNPTGTFKTRAELEKFIAAVNPETLIVLDEAYMEFADPDGKENFFKDADKYGNLIVLRTLSKVFGSAALRIGFAAADKEIIGCLKRVKSPYNLNTISQEFARVVIKNYGSVREIASVIISETKQLHSKLSNLKTDMKYELLPTHANFHLMRFVRLEDAQFVYNELKKRGISIRFFKGLSSLRITTGTAQENLEFVAAIEEIMR